MSRVVIRPDPVSLHSRNELGQILLLRDNHSSNARIAQTTLTMAAILPQAAFRALRTLPRVASVPRTAVHPGIWTQLPRAPQPLNRRFVSNIPQEQPRLRLGATGMCQENQLVILIENPGILTRWQPPTSRPKPPTATLTSTSSSETAGPSSSLTLPTLPPSALPNWVLSPS